MRISELVDGCSTSILIRIEMPIYNCKALNKDKVKKNRETINFFVVCSKIFLVIVTLFYALSIQKYPQLKKTTT